MFKTVSNNSKIIDKYDDQELHTKFPAPLIYISFHILDITL